MSLTLIRVNKKNRGSSVTCRCSCRRVVVIPSSVFYSGHKKTCGRKECTARLLSKVHSGQPRPDLVGKKPHNWKDLTGVKKGKLTFLKQVKGGRWECLCECGNKTEVSTGNLARTNGCRHCTNRKDIRGEKRGLLTAEGPEEGVVKNRPPLWTFRCDCGNSIQATVREFHFNLVRSCGCHDSTYGSWRSMMDRCYCKTNNRYKSYGGRGIKVNRKWHKFENFVADMGERPKKHTISRRKAEKGYSSDNCFWEHVSANGRDTKNDGQPTKPGLLKGARSRDVA